MDKIIETVWKANGLYGQPLKEFIQELQKAVQEIPEQYRDTARVSMEAVSDYGECEAVFAVEYLRDRSEKDKEEEIKRIKMLLDSNGHCAHLKDRLKELLK